MLAYAANRPDPAGRRSSPNVMLFIVAAHIAAIAALMSYRMDLPQRLRSAPLVVDLLRDPPPPQPQPVTKSTPIEQTNEWLTNPQPKIPTEPIGQPQVDLRGTPSADPGPIVGPSIDPVPLPQPQPKLTTVRVGPQLLTPASQLRPPYPASKLLNEEEAVLRLRLSIGADGHVTAVDPIGRVDGVFLDAARRYLIAHWRYRPATVDGRGIATTTEITLSFQLDS
jgi:protein TonB